MTDRSSSSVMNRSLWTLAGLLRGHIAASVIRLRSTHRIRAGPDTLARVAEGAATIAAAFVGELSQRADV
jgi:hypothetical protein